MEPSVSCHLYFSTSVQELVWGQRIHSHLSVGRLKSRLVSAPTQQGSLFREHPPRPPTPTNTRQWDHQARPKRGSRSRSPVLTPETLPEAGPG